jgi:predicted peptidase
MKSFLTATVLLGFTLNVIWSQEPMPKANQKPRSFERKITKKVRADYLLFLPRDYQQRGNKRWPLILFLHGAGERGTNLTKVTVHGPPKIVKEKPDFPFIVVSPQCPVGQSWSNDTLSALLDEVTAKLKVDTNRVYLTGLSMGGFGTWSLALAQPERFAAIAPICGGGDYVPLLLSDRSRTAALKTLGVWAFHGGKDDLVKPIESERMVDAFRRFGNDAKLTIYRDAGHDSWTETYDNPELYEWFLRHRR